ncbi:MAG: hypothetical protein AAFR63_13485 [Cyanobacteria bacterium J06631_6]
MKNIICLASCATLLSISTIANAGELNKTSPQYVAIASEDVRVANHDGITYEMHGCARQGSSVTCSFFMTSEGQDRTARINAKSTRFIDFEGNEYLGSSAQIGSSSGSSAQKSLIDGITMKGSISFTNIPRNVNDFAVLDIHAGNSDRLRFKQVFLIDDDARYTCRNCEENNTTSSSENRSINDNLNDVKDATNTMKETGNTVKDIIRLF